MRIELSDLYALGAELFRWEFATAVAGSMIDIDPFDQPDVEEAKVLARQLTDRYDQEGSLPEISPLWERETLKLYADDRNGAELTRAVNHSNAESRRPNLADFVAAHLARARVGDYVALLAYVQMAPAHEAVLTEMRTLIRDTFRVATCVGFGPRFQHSTGQTYKGGPNTGVFLQITCDDAVEVAVPGHRYGFGLVKEAEARSDLEVLGARGRRALRVHLGADVTAGLEQLRAAFVEAIETPSGRL